ncbi:MAG: ABC transporter permease [Planctomycetia bacterium]
MTERLENWFGPPAVRELKAVARSRLTFVLRVAVALVLLGLLFSQYRLFGQSIEPRKMQFVGQGLFAGVVFVQTLALWVAVAAFTADVFNGERRRGSLDLLFTTSLTIDEIVLGKILGRAAGALFLVAAGLPILFLTVLLGGVSPFQLVYTELLTLFALALYVNAAVRVAVHPGSAVYLFFRILLQGILIYCGGMFAFGLVVAVTGGAGFGLGGTTDSLGLLGTAAEMTMYALVVAGFHIAWRREIGEKLHVPLKEIRVAAEAKGVVAPDKIGDRLRGCGSVLSTLVAIAFIIPIFSLVLSILAVMGTVLAHSVAGSVFHPAEAWRNFSEAMEYGAAFFFLGEFRPILPVGWILLWLITAVRAATHRRTTAPPAWVDAVNGTALSTLEQLAVVACSVNESRSKKGGWNPGLTALYGTMTAVTLSAGFSDLPGVLFTAAVGVLVGVLLVAPSVAACVAGAGPGRLTVSAVLPILFFVLHPLLTAGGSQFAAPLPELVIGATAPLAAVVAWRRRVRPGVFSIVLHAWTLYFALAAAFVYQPTYSSAGLPLERDWVTVVNPLVMVFDATSGPFSRVWPAVSEWRPDSPAAAVGMVAALALTAAAVLYEAVVGYDRLAGRVEPRPSPRTPTDVRVRRPSEPEA